MCTLRIYGKSLDVDAFARAAGLTPAGVHRGSRPSINVGVSDASMDDLPAQIADAIRFLERNGAQLKAAAASAQAEGMVMDFAIASRPVSAQYDSFPPELLAALGVLGIGLEVSRYER